MQLKVLLKWASFIGAIVVLASSVTIIFPPSDTKVSSALSLTSGEQASIGLGIPIRLEIPAISVDVAILPVGLAADGSMGVPKGPDDVAWFDVGKRPGENGTAVIAGHYGWKGGIPAVFDNLSALRKGDKISVLNDKGEAATFMVRESRTLYENENASEVFNSSDGKAHLNLITCEGVWDAASKSYSQRLVVFADEE